MKIGSIFSAETIVLVLFLLIVLLTIVNFMPEAKLKLLIELLKAILVNSQKMLA